jgi:glycosyltransferase involved in cell wall biosynthesis
MSSSAYRDKIISWSSDSELDYVLLNGFLEYLGENLFHDFEPTAGSHPAFINRFEDWINNLKSEEDQQRLFELSLKIFYIGREEFLSLYRTAYTSTYFKWLFDILGLNLSSDYKSSLEDALGKTWFCPVTDSFKINQFYHINEIKTRHTFRPDWRSLKKFGSENRIHTYLKCNQVEYLVLLEDFVGTGTQANPVIKFAHETCPNLKILFIPLIIYPSGYNLIRDSQKEASNFTIDPVILLSEEELINRPCAEKNPDIQEFIHLINKSKEFVFNGFSADFTRKISEYGFGETGGLTVTFSNTPNNSLPLIYLDSPEWKSLFKRHFRD